jgi:predicted dehydrogenase
MSEKITRRQFSTGLVAAGAALAGGRAASAALGANDKVRLGFIGLGNRGDQLISAFLKLPDVTFAGLCDVYAPYIDFAKTRVGGEPFTTPDYRKLLDRKDIDAVVIATPDHWHAKNFVDACAAGKDVYVEKPLALTVSEGRKMVQAAEQYKRVACMGVHRRSAPVCEEMVKLIQSGAIGKVTVARCYYVENETPMGIGKSADSNPPAGLDWDMWLGPAKKRPYNENRCFYKFRWFREYSGGQLTNMGTHYLDLIQWALGQEAPKSVVAVGGRYAVDDDREIPDTMEVIWEYPNGTIATFSQFNANSAPADAKDSELEFRGTKGTLYYRGGRLEIVPEKVRKQERPPLDPTRRKEVSVQLANKELAIQPLVKTFKGDEVEMHARNFVDCVRSRKATNCPIEVGHRSTTATLIANIAYDRQRSLVWDGKTEQFTNDPEANKLLGYEYRAPWKL